MKHILIKDPLLNGWEYGTLRSFEQAIVKETNAEVNELPDYELASNYLHHFGHGMKRSVYRKYFPKQALDLKADVAWSLLMGPENYRLDLYKDWETSCKTKILYLFDTLPAQYPLIKRLFSNNKWDILITSFNDAVDDLEKITGRQWHCSAQGTDEDLFPYVPLNERLIHFSSYGRRHPILHEVLKEFCLSKGLYYDYTTHDGKNSFVNAAELYRQYSWHISHSLFTVSWPVELTNPVRAGHLHPITCRWFEAAASGTVILGRQPDNVMFNRWLGEHIVVEIDYSVDKQNLLAKLESVWSDRENLFTKASRLRENKINTWTWNERVNRILSWL